MVCGEGSRKSESQTELFDQSESRRGVYINMAFREKIAPATLVEKRKYGMSRNWKAK